MNDTDTSDEAFWEWVESPADRCTHYTERSAWREAVRRCEARMEEERRKAFCYAAGWVKGLMVTGNVPTTDQILEACHAFKEGQK